MLRNYLKIALRTLRKHKLYAFVNIGGLAIGMACAMLIFLYVHNDLSFDGFHSKADRIYRVLTIDRALGVSSQRVGITLPALGAELRETLPEVETAVRMNNQGRTLLSIDDRDLYAESGFLAENAFFTVFDFPLLAGNPETVLTQPNTVVLTETLARRLFGDEDPLGRTLQQNNNADLTVVGIVADPPANSHLQFDLLGALVAPEDQPNFQQYLQSWNNISMITYVLLDDPASAAGLDAKMEQIIRSHDVGENFSVTTQPLADVHLRSSNVLYGSNVQKSDIGYVYALSAVALFVLLIAAFNFMNLATARSAERAREVGLRKVVGALRSQLIAQHLGESMLLCAVAFLLAFGLVQLALPWVGNFIGRPLAFDLINQPELLAWIVGGAVLLAVLAGSYPAFVLARFQPAHVLKGAFTTGRQGVLLRKVLVVTQFTASVVMIIGALIASQQLHYIQEKNMGYDREQVLVLTLNSLDLQENADLLEDELLNLPAVRHVARAGSLPGRTFGRTTLQPEGAQADDTWITSITGVSEGFFETLGMQIIAGRAFSEDYGTDQQEAAVINEAAARAFGWDAPLGKRITLGQQEREVIGIVGDFHFATLRHQIEPLVLLPGNGPLPLMAVKMDTRDLDQILASIEATWHRLNPDYPFEYSFLNDEFEAQYRAEISFATLAQGFTGLAILIACLGLFGLATFTATQRTKEIGVRKVLGASVPGLMLLLSKDFVRLVLVAIVLATPLAYFVMRSWLQDFAYRIDLSWPIFLMAGLAALVIAIATVSYQAFKTAMVNPVKALKYE